MLKNCLTCGEEFKTKPSLIKRGLGKYCTRKCQPPPTKGHKHSDETKQQMKESQKGSKHHHWKGGIKISGGYVFMKIYNHPFRNKNYVKRSRLAVEKEIGRYLTPEEVVHHRGKKYDDLPHMLMAFCSDSAHGRFHQNPKNVKPEEIIFDGRKLLKIL